MAEFDEPQFITRKIIIFPRLYRYGMRNIKLKSGSLKMYTNFMKINLSE